MKQGKHYTTIILWLFILALVAYLGYSMFSSFQQAYTTALAIEYEAGTGCYATGYVVRDELVIVSEYDITVLSASEGAHMAAGEPVAVGYLSPDAQSRRSRIDALEEQITQLRHAERYSSSLADQAALDKQILSGLYAGAQYLNRRDMTSLADLAPELKGLVLRRSSTAEEDEIISAQLAAAEQELSFLQTASEQDTKNIPAPVAGCFSSLVDGYETVLTPEKLQNLRAATFEDIEPAGTAENAAGKMILGETWYFVTTVPAAELKGVSEGDRVRVTFARDYYDELEMRVERVGQNEAGSRLLILSCDRYMQNITQLRKQSADIVFATHDGLRVPKQAVRVDENGQAGVYILEGANAKWKPISILHDNGESYVVALDKSKTGNLWPGDEIIVTARDLYDGKVVSQ